MLGCDLRKWQCFQQSRCQAEGLSCRPFNLSFSPFVSFPLQTVEAVKQRAFTMHRVAIVNRKEAGKVLKLSTLL